MWRKQRGVWRDERGFLFGGRTSSSGRVSGNSIVNQSNGDPTPDYWIAPSGTGDGSYESPDDFAGGEAQASGGSVIGCKDGTYTTQFLTTKAGSSGSVITFIAENDGAAILDGEFTQTPLISNHNYRDWIGFTARRGANAGDANRVTMYITGSYNNVKRVGVQSVTAHSYSFCVLVGGQHNLLEDVFVWGAFRTGIEVADELNTLRRCVVRQDAVPDVGNPNYPCGIRHYHYEGSSAGIVENCIVVDCDLTTGSGTQTGGGAFKHRSYDASEHMQYFGCIADVASRTIGDHDCWRLEGDSHVLTHCCGINADGWFFANTGPNHDAASTLTNCTGYSNSLGFDSYVSYEPVQNDCLESSATLTYPLQADGSGDGCTIVKRYVDGVLTADDLWPFPHQARIRSEMGGTAYTPSSYFAAASPTRGFCDSGETLTHYIWNDLGNGSPY